VGILSRQGPPALAVIMRREARSRGKPQSRRAAVQGGTPSSILAHSARDGRSWPGAVEHGAIHSSSQQRAASSAA
jgi:hypothetical protein